jgi:hypothetical protein
METNEPLFCCDPQKVSDYILELVCDETDSRIPVLDEC